MDEPPALKRKRDKLLDAMRANPGSDWKLSQVATLCSRYQIIMRRPGRGGSHVTLSHFSQQAILTIPNRKPIKLVYIARLIIFIDAVLGATHERS